MQQRNASHWEGEREKCWPYQKYIRWNNSNPIFDSQEYVVLYPVSTYYTLTYAKVVENTCSNIDESGNQHNIFSGLVVHRNRKGTVDNMKLLYEKNYWRHNKLTIAGWDLEVEYKYGNTSWISMNQ